MPTYDAMILRRYTYKAGKHARFDCGFCSRYRCFPHTATCFPWVVGVAMARGFWGLPNAPLLVMPNPLSPLAFRYLI